MVVNRVVQTDIKLDKKDKVLYGYIGAMLIGLFLRNALGMPISVFLFLVLSAIPLLYGRDEHMLAVIASCITSSAGFQYKYALLLCIVIYCFKNKGKLKQSPVLILVLLMAFWEFLHIGMGFFSIAEWLRYFAELFVFAMVTCMNMKRINYRIVFRALSITLVGICLIMIFLQMKQGGSISAIFTRSAAAYRFGKLNTVGMAYGLNYNPNGLGFRCGLSAIVMLFLHIRKENNLIDTLLLLLSIMFGIATMSRTFILCMIGVFICYFLFSGSVKQRIKYLVLVLVLIISVYFGMKHFFPTLINNIELRFQAEDITNGRSDLFGFYNQMIFSSITFMFFGIGIQGFGDKIAQIYGTYDNICHNGFQQIWVVWGIVGVILFILMLIAMVLMAKKYVKKPKMIQYIPFVYMIVYAMGGQLITSTHVLLSLVIVYLCMCIEFGDDR